MTIDTTTLEILRMARDIVINEYTDRRAQDHNAWLVKSEEQWNTNRTKLPYPVIPPYPTEHDVVARAKVLLDFLKKPEPVEVPQETVSYKPKSIEEICGDWTSTKKYA